MVVETYSHVLHIVSQVSGTLRDGVSAMDALRSILPAGTLSGAPKVRAMQIIDELEPHEARLVRRARSATSATRGISTPRSTSARSSSRTGWSTYRRAAEPSRTPSRPTSTTSRSTRRRRSSGPSRSPPSSRSGHEPACSSSTTTTPSPTTSSSTSGSWARRSAWSATTRPRSTSCSRLEARPAGRLARSVHAEGGGHLGRGGPLLRRGGHSGPRRLPRAPVAGRGVRRQGGPRRPDPRQGRGGQARRQGDLRGPLQPAGRRPLPLAGRRPAICPRSSS